MRHFATESGKSKGQFYTPAEVSRVMAQVIGIGRAQTSAKTTVYDPTCGSGSLLLKVGDAAGTQVTLYGQEKDSATSGLARMNMILHDNPTAQVEQANTLTDPRFTDDKGQLKTFDYVVANPPFSDKRWSTGLTPDKDKFERFKPYGIPPGKQGDYAYLLHIVRSLKSTGKGACILPHGVLFRGNAEAAIRKNLIERGLLKGIIGLPANLFYGTGIPACILVLDKEHAAANKGIFMIDASKGFIKDGPKNRLREQDIHRIVDTFSRQLEVPGYSRMVPVSEISDAKNDLNLNLPRYIDGSDPEDLQDIDGHLRGGIPTADIDALQRYWAVIPGVRNALFEAGNRAGYSELKVPAAEIKSTIFGHAEFTAFNQAVTKHFTKWKAKNAPLLHAIDGDTKPKQLIHQLSEDLLAAFAKAPLLDAYDVYQHLMDYWGQTLQDDCYLIVAEGWKAAAQPKLIVEDKSKKTKTKPDFSVGKKKYQTELLPPALLIARYFAKQQADIEALEAQVAGFDQQLEELAEEHGAEGGLLEDAKNDKDKLTKASVAARLEDIEGDKDADDERKLLTEYLDLVEAQATANTSLKTARDTLTELVAAKYAKLTEAEIKTLAVEDKWVAALATAVDGELDRVSQTLATRTRQLAERYASPLPQVIEEVATLSTRVDAHLRKMGAVWN
jgi:type I restriction enzyme M protein